MFLSSIKGALTCSMVGLLAIAVAPGARGEGAVATDNAVPSLSTDGIAPAKLALLNKLCELLAPGKNAEESLNTTFANQEKQLDTIFSALIRSKAPADASPEDLQKMKDTILGRQMRILKRTQQLFREQIDLNQLCNSIYVSIYNKHFDEKQLKDLIAFYQSPTGKRYREVQTAIVSEAMAMTNKAIEGKIISISKQVESELQAKPAPDASDKPAASGTADKATDKSADKAADKK